MKITTFTKPGSIYLTFDAPVADVYRREENETYFNLICSARTGCFYEDFFDDYGTGYVYKIVDSDGNVAETPVVWSFDAVCYFGAVQSSHKGSGNSNTLMARIFNTLNADLLQPNNVTEVIVRAVRYLENDIVSNQEKEIKNERLEKTEAIMSNPTVTPDWTLDDIGYNFRIIVPDYTFPVHIESTIRTKENGDILLRWNL